MSKNFSDDRVIRAVLATEVADGRVYQDVKSKNKVLARRLLDNFAEYLIDEDNHALSRSMLLTQFLVNNESFEDYDYVLTRIKSDAEANRLLAPLILENSYKLTPSAVSPVADNMTKYFIREGLKHHSRKGRKCDH